MGCDSTPRSRPEQAGTNTYQKRILRWIKSQRLKNNNRHKKTSKHQVFHQFNREIYIAKSHDQFTSENPKATSPTLQKLLVSSLLWLISNQPWQ
jgi:hypothetical protein